MALPDMTLDRESKGFDKHPDLSIVKSNNAVFLADGSDKIGMVFEWNHCVKETDKMMAYALLFRAAPDLARAAHDLERFLSLRATDEDERFWDEELEPLRAALKSSGYKVDEQV